MVKVTCTELSQATQLPGWNHFNPGYVRAVNLLNFWGCSGCLGCLGRWELLGLLGGWCFFQFPQLVPSVVSPGAGDGQEMREMGDRRLNEWYLRHLLVYCPATPPRSPIPKTRSRLPNPESLDLRARGSSRLCPRAPLTLTPMSTTEKREKGENIFISTKKQTHIHYSIPSAIQAIRILNFSLLLLLRLSRL